MRYFITILLLTVAAHAAPVGFQEQPIAGTNLYGWWPLNESSLSTLASSADKSRWGNTAWPSNNNVSMIAGVADKGIAIQTNVLTVTNTWQLSSLSSNAFSVSCWFWMSNAPAAGQQFAIVGKCWWPSLAINGWSLDYKFVSGTTYQLDMVKCGSIDQNLTIAALPTTTWIHLVAVQNWASGAPTTCVYYTNGVSCGFVSNATVYDGNNAASPKPNFYIGSGGLSASFGVPFPGRIDDVALYSCALTAEQVLRLYNSGASVQRF